MGALQMEFKPLHFPIALAKPVYASECAWVGFEWWKGPSIICDLPNGNDIDPDQRTA